MPDEAECAAVIEILHRKDHYRDRMKGSQRPILLGIFERMEIAVSAPGEHVAGFTNYVSAQPV